MANQKDIWSLQLIKYLILHKGYTQVRFISAGDFVDAENDVWLANPNAVYPSIHITKNLQSINKARENVIREEAASLYNVIKKSAKLLDISLDESGESSEGIDMIHLALYPGCELPASIKSVFENLNTVIFNVDEPENEAERLQADIDSYVLGNRNPAQRKRQNLRESFSLTFLLSAVISIAVFIAVNALSYVFNYSSVSLAIVFGAYYKAFILIFNDWWRLLTAGFVHISLWHIWCNLLALFSISKFVENKLGTVKSLIILVVSIIIGNLCVFIGDGNVVAVGLSGGIYGLLATVMVIYWQEGYLKLPMLRRQLINTLLINLIINFMPNVSVLAHIGGFVTGLFLSFIFMDISQKSLKRNFMIVGVVLLLSLGYFASQSMNLDRIYLGTDLEISEFYNKMGLRDIAADIAARTAKYYGGV